MNAAPTPAPADDRTVDVAARDQTAPLDELCAAWARGERPTARDYLARFPDLPRLDAAALVYAEYMLRTEWGYDEFLRAYPEWAGEARKLRATDRAVDDLADDPPPAPPAEPPAGDSRRFGPYELGERIGRGGRAAVYEAVDARLGRRVAVKLIPVGMTGATDVVRFRDESEAQARLAHPNVVPVYDCGEADDYLWFAMELAAGGSLADALAGTPLPPTTAAELVRTVAGAVAAAHALKIIHRDLKPANILLAGDARPTLDTTPRNRVSSYTPKVADFGLARRTDAADGPTATGVIVGTPSYMAPEQARGEKDVGPLADVYGLGAVLYELLTGRPPFRAATPIETIHLVLKDDPVPPSRLVPKLPRDLETVCLKCLAKEPGKRYATAKELADDLKRFLANQPVVARPVSAAERGWRWCRRNPRVAGLAAALAVVLVASVVGLTALWRKASGERDRANETAIREADQRQRAVAFRRQAEELVDYINQTADRRLADFPNTEPLRREMAERVVHFYEGFVAAAGGDAAARADSGRALVRVGEVRGWLGDWAESEAAFGRAVATFQQLADEFPDDGGYRAARDNALSQQAVARLNAGRPDDALATYANLLAVVTAAPNADPRTVARVHHYRSAALMLATRYNEAAADCRETIARLGESTHPDDQPVLAAAHARLGEALLRTGDPKGEMKGAFARALALYKQLPADPTASDPGAARACTALARMLRRNRQPDDARLMYARAQGMYERLAKDFPAVPDHTSELADTLGVQASMDLDAKAGEPARAKLTRAIELQRAARRAVPDHPTFRKRLRNHLMIFAELLTGASDHAGGAAAAVEAVGFADQPMDYLQVGTLLTVCYQLADLDTKLMASEKKAAMDRYLGQLTDVLRSGAKAKLISAAHLRDAAFNPVRWHPKFQALVAELTPPVLPPPRPDPLDR